VIERLLLDRVNTETGRTTISRQHHLIVHVLAYKASSTLAFVQLAVTRAKVTLDSWRLAIALGQVVPPACWMRRFRVFYVSFHFLTP